jgi:hypothetical protein
MKLILFLLIKLLYFFNPKLGFNAYITTSFIKKFEADIYDKIKHLFLGKKFEVTPSMFQPTQGVI